MWLVEREQVGAIAYGRMQRDGAIRTIVPGLALPHDVWDSPAVRRAVLQRCIPAGCQVTGLGVLWASGYSPLPAVVDVRTTVGRHVRNWHETVPLKFHAAGISGEPDDHEGYTGLGGAIADALRWAPLERAVPSVVRAWADQGKQARVDLAESVTGRVGGHERAQSAWATVQGALDAASRGQLGEVALSASDAPSVKHAVDLAHGVDDGSKV